MEEQLSSLPYDRSVVSKVIAIEDEATGCYRVSTSDNSMEFNFYFQLQWNFNNFGNSVW